MAGRLPHVSMRGTLSRLNWRITLVQFLANAIVIGLLILLLPGFELHATHELLAVLWLAAVFGVITALVRPALEFLFLPYVLQSLGLVMVAINAILLALLGLTSVLEIKGVVPLLIGAVVAGVVGFFLDSVLGLTPPVLDDASVRAARSERALRIAGVSERLRVMQLYGILLQYIVDLAFDWAWLRPVRRPMQEWLWRVPVPVAKLPPQVKVRLLLEDLGPTYVKLGQILSSQGRALPLEWEDELAKLQSEVRPVRLRRRSRDRRAVARRAAGDAVRVVQPDAARGGVARAGARGDDARRSSRRREGAAPEHPRAAAVRHQDPDARRRGARAPSRAGPPTPTSPESCASSGARCCASWTTRSRRTTRAGSSACSRRSTASTFRPSTRRSPRAACSRSSSSTASSRRTHATSTPPDSTGKSSRGTSFAARCRWS